MGLKESNVTKNISKDAMLWRYMTLDKLINILSTNQLYIRMKRQIHLKGFPQRSH